MGNPLKLLAKLKAPDIIWKYILKRRRVIVCILLIISVLVLFPKPCGRFTTAAVPVIEYKCYGVKTAFFSIGGGSLFCFGICNLSEKDPSFYCTESKDCISGCGWRAGNGGCIAVNEKSKDYLECNRLTIENRFPLLCYRNSCAFKVNEMIISFQARESGEIVPYDLLNPETSSIGGYFWLFLRTR